MREKYTFFVEINSNAFNIAVFGNISNDIVFIESFSFEKMKERTNLELNKQEIFKHFILAINSIEKKFNYRISEIILIQNGNINLSNFKFKIDFESARKIKNKDFDRLFTNALNYFNESIINNNEEFIINEIIPIQYYRDSEKINKKSEGYGKSLAADFLFLYSSKSSINNTISIFESMRLGIQNFFFAPISFSLLNIDSPTNLYLDFDTYSTSYCIFDNLKNTFHYNSFKIGEFEIINDIKKILKIKLEEAEEIWNLMNDLIKKDSDHIINIKSDHGNIVVSIEKILSIISARITEVFDLIKKDISSKSITINELYIKNKMNANLMLKEITEKVFQIKPKTYNIYSLIKGGKIPENRSIEDLEKILISVEYYKKFNHLFFENAKSVNKFELGKISCFLKNIFY